MDKVSSDITKITLACTTAQENTGILIENAISQALTNPNLAINSRPFGTNQASSSPYKSNWTSYWQTNNFGIPQNFNNDMYHPKTPYETPTSLHAYVNQQPPNPYPF